MKKIYTIVIVCLLLQALFIGKGMGTVIHITMARDTLTYISQQNQCGFPVYDYFSIQGTATGYLSTDSVTIQIFFGDGNNRIAKCPIVSNNFHSSQINWAYYSSGNMSFKFLVTGPDGNADSVIQNNQLFISDTCGNVSGKVYLDNNSNCIYDAGDSLLANFPVMLYQGINLVSTAYTDLQGNYFLSAPAGNYTIKTSTASTGFQISCPSSGQYNITLSSTSTGNDLGVNCLNSFDMAGVIEGADCIPGFNLTWIAFDIINLRCSPTSGTVKVILDPLETYNFSIHNAPTSISGDTLIWNYSNINCSFFYNWNTHWYDWINGNTFSTMVRLHTSPTAVLGDSVCYTMIISPTTGDADTTNNKTRFCHVIDMSFDPNFMQVTPKGVGVNNSISANQKLTYTIHFQNTGTDTARNISLYDTLDANLDVTTLQMLEADHNFMTEMLPGNVLKFIFNNIMLPDSTTNETMSQGHISYSIKPKAGLPNGTFIYNKAAIVFDYNIPVITNITHNMIDLTLGINEYSPINNDISIYPNPANITLTIHQSTIQPNQHITITNVLGRIVYSQLLNQSTDSTIDISTLNNGIYFYEVSNERGSARGKFVKQ